VNVVDIGQINAHHPQQGNDAEYQYDPAVRDAIGARRGGSSKCAVRHWSTMSTRLPVG
jgi:hypothetical protein